MKPIRMRSIIDEAGADLRWLGSGPAYLDELEQAGFHVG